MGEGPGVGGRVTEGVTVELGRRVRVGVAVRVGVGVRVGVPVRVDVALGSGVGASPSTVKLPETFQFSPEKICTSYSPGNHSEGSGSQSV